MRARLRRKFSRIPQKIKESDARTRAEINMNPQLAQSLFALALSALVASVVSSLVYFFFRYCLSEDALLTFASYSLIGCGFLMIAGIVWIGFSLHFIALCFCILLFGFIGGILHQKSNNASEDPLIDFGLSFSVNLFSLILNFALLSSTALLPTQLYPAIERSPYFIPIFLVFIMAQSLTTPFLIWAWKNSRLRPGIDKHLED